MSSIIFALDATQAILATDTLCTSFVGQPSFFGSKAYMLPHMNMLLAFSGPVGFLEHWWVYLNTKKLYPGIECLSRSAQGELTTLWLEWKEANPWPAEIENELAVFHLGISELTGEVVGFAHTSWDGFEPEEISYRVRGDAMLYAKPKCTIPTVEDMSAFPQAFLPMMQEQRANQAAKVYGEGSDGTVMIGGELQIHHLTPQGCAAYKLGRFDDYERVEKDLWGDWRSSVDRTAGTIAQR